jgi:hypothetical protein
MNALFFLKQEVRWWGLLKNHKIWPNEQDLLSNYY